MQQPLKIKMRTISAGELGDLSVVESKADLPFSIRRIYYIYGVRKECRRGFHAHKTLQQCLIVLKGQCRLELEGPAGRFIFQLNQPNEGVIIPPGYWREMHGLDQDTVILVLASSDYDEGDYIRDYGVFKESLKQNEAIDSVPYIDLGRYVRLVGQRLEEAACGVINQGIYINGPQLEAFEKEFANTCQAAYAVGVANGLDALGLILEALGIKAGDEVVVCAAGFVATALAVSLVGAKPMFVESLPFGNLDPAALEASLTPRTRAIIPTHLYGLPVDWEPIWATAKKHGLMVIEDACQAHGAAYNRRPCGSLGQAAAFSFYPTKNLGALGDGGAVTTNDRQLAEKVRALANYGALKKYDHQLLGRNSRLDELQAAFLRVKLPHLAAWNESRRRLVSVYRETLGELQEHLALPEPRLNDTPAWHVYPILVHHGRRDELATFLASRGVGTNIHYPKAIHQQGCYAHEPDLPTLPVAEAWAAKVLSLPLGALHEPEEMHYVSRCLVDFFTKQ